MGVPRRGPAWLRWLGVPWSERVTAATLVAAAAVPVFLVASVGVWRSAARDEVTARAVADRSPAAHGIDVRHEVLMDPTAVPAADVAIREAAARIPGLAEPDLTLYTLPGLLTVGPPVRQVGPPGRLLARPGALDAIEVVDRLDAGENGAGDGVFVSTWFAEREGLEVGDGIAFESGAIADEQWNDLVAGGGTASVFRIVGLYEPLWSEDPDHELDPYWASAPPEVVPRFVSAFNGPSSELVIASEETVLASGLTGIARWRAGLTEIPTSYEELRTVRDRMRRFEAALVEPGPLRDALAASATSAAGRPRLSTELFETTSDVESAAALLEGPLASARTVGAAVGLLALVAVGAFLVERRRSEFRLLVGEGRGPLRLVALVGAQLLAPTALGATCGVMAAVAGLRWLGPAERHDLSAVDWSGVALITVFGWAVAAVVAGSMASRVLADRLVPPRVVATAATVSLAVACAAAWWQVGRTGAAAGSDVDLAVVALPVLGVALAVTAAVLVVGALIARTAGDGSRLPLPLFLTLRRLAVGGGGLRIVAGAVGLGVGLLVFAVALTSTLDRTVDIKLATVVGGASTLTVSAEPEPDVRYPERTTLVRTWDTVISPGEIRVRVIAIDPTTWPDAVSWPEPFGSSPDEVARLLAAPRGDAVAAVAVSGERTPSSGAFGLARTYPFEVVDRVDALPGASATTVTLLISGPALEQLALEEEGYATRQEAAADGFVLPTVRFTRRLVSQAPLAELVEAVEAAGLQYRDASSLAERRRDPEVVAARSAFAYLGVLGVAAAFAAVVGLGLFLAGRRRARALGSVMTRSMGLPATRASLVTTLEVAAVLLISMLGAFAAVPLVVHRLTPRFDPAPDVPPDVRVVVDWVPLIGTAALALVAVSAIVWSSELRSARRPAGEVLRDLE